jgi:hypothetical protein
MRPASHDHRRLLLVAIVCAVHLGCGGKGGDGGSVVTPPPPPTQTFRCSQSPVTIDQVALQCGVNLTADVWQIDVVIGSPTRSTDIDGFAFDVLFDPTLLTYVNGSARAGNLFFQGGLAPLVVAQTQPGEPGRLVVGIHPSGTGGGVQGTPTFNQILIFNMKLAGEGTFDPYLLRFDNHEALDSLDQPISSITFSDQLLLSNQ